MKDLQAANRYARALFEAVRESHDPEEMLEELRLFSSALKADPEIERFLNNPAYRKTSKLGVLEKVYEKKTGVQNLLFRFLAVLLRKNRFNIIHEAAASFKRILDESKGVGEARIVTAVPLSSESEKQIVARLEKVTGHKITARKEVDAAVVGGIKVQIGNRIIDGSVIQKISLIKKDLTKVRTV